MGSKCTHLILLAHWSAQREARDLLTSGSTCEHGLRRQHSSQAHPVTRTAWLTKVQGHATLARKLGTMDVH